MQAPTSAPTDDLISLRNLISFIAHVAQRYSDITGDFPHDLLGFISNHHDSLEPSLRETVVNSLVLLRRKALLDSAVYGFFSLITLANQY